MVYHDLQNYHQAIVDFNKAIELDSQYASAYANRGRTYRDLQNYSQALSDINYAIEHNPTSAWFYLQRGYCYLYMDGVESAKTDFVKSWQLNSKEVNYGWMIEFTDMCRQRPDTETAERLENIAKADEQLLEAYICQAVAHWLRGNHEQALAKLKQALIIKSPSEDTHFWQGMILVTLDRYGEAIAAIEKSLEVGLPPILLSPLRWFEQDKPDFYATYIVPLLARYL